MCECVHECETGNILEVGLTAARLKACGRRPTQQNACGRLRNETTAQQPGYYTKRSRCMTCFCVFVFVQLSVCVSAGITSPDSLIQAYVQTGWVTLFKYLWLHFWHNKIITAYAYTPIRTQFSFAFTFFSASVGLSRGVRV